MDIVQDMLCGSICKFAMRDMFLDWNHIQNILLWVPNCDGNVPTPAIIKCYMKRTLCRSKRNQVVSREVLMKRHYVLELIRRY